MAEVTLSAEKVAELEAAEEILLTVTDGGQPLKNINELEWVKGEIYANVWLTSVIVRIDPASLDQLRKDRACLEQILA